MTKEDLIQHSQVFEQAASDFLYLANGFGPTGIRYSNLINHHELCLGIAQGYRLVANRIKE